MFRHLARPRKESRALPTPLPLQPVGHGRKIKRMLQLEGQLADAMVGGWSLGIRAYKNTTAEQRAFRARVNRTQERLLVITSALRQILADNHFTTLLKAESLDTIPQRLAMRVTHHKMAV